MRNKKMVLKSFVRTIYLTLMVLMILTASAFSGEKEQKQDPPIVVTKITDDVFVIANGPIIDSSTTFIVSDEGVLVIDTRVNPAEALKVLREIRKVTSKPIKYVINTHFHGDHVFGNEVFAESSTIIAHENVKLFLEGKSGEDHLAFFKGMGIPGLEDTKIILPNISYQKGLDIAFGKFNLQVRYLGKGHTNSDTIVYLPNEKILITGDLVFNGKIPFAGHAHFDEWIKRTEELEKFDAEIVIPGHGNVGNKSIISNMKRYFIKLKNEVSKRTAKGKSLEETQKEVTEVMGEYKTWKNFDWLPGNIATAYKEFGGK